MRGREFSDFVRLQLAPAFADVPDTAWGLKLRPLSLLLEVGFGSIYPPALDRMIDFVSCFDMGSATGRKVAQYNLATVVEREARGTSQFSTPTTWAELMVEALDPRPGASIYCPCFGTGQLLARIVRKARNRVASVNAEVSGPEHALSRVFGVESNPFAYVVGAAQAVLAGASNPRLELGNALQVSPAEMGADDGFDYVMAHPPWGRMNRKLGSGVEVPTKEMAMHFLQHVMAALAPGGRAAVLLPPAALYRGGPDLTIRRRLLSDYAVEGVIAVEASEGPSRHMYGEMNLLVFGRAVPRSTVRFLRVPSDRSATPREIVAAFRNGRASHDLWDLTVPELEARDFAMHARRSGHRALVSELKRLREVECGIRLEPLGETAEVLAPRLSLRGLGTGPRPTGDVGVLRPADITDSGVRPPSVFLDESGVAAMRPEHRLRKDDIVLTVDGRVGRIGVVGEMASSATAPSVAVIRPGDEVSSHFLKSLLASDTYQKWLRGHARGTAIQRLSVARLRELPVPVPPRDLQERVVRLVSGERGDPFATIVRVLTGRDDPVVEWFEESPEVRQLHDIADIADGVALLETVAGSLQRISAEVRDTPTPTLPELARWLEEVKEPVAALEGLSDVPPGPERLAVLDGLSVELERITALQDSSSPATALAYDVTRRISRLATLERERILSDVAVDADIEPGWVAADAGGEVQLRLTNRSLLPLRRFEAFTVPQIGGARTAYLAAGATLDVPIRIPSDAPIGSYRFTVRWRATLLNRRQATDRIPLAVEVRTSSPADRVREIGSSPYIVGSPIDRKDMLFGREAVIEEIRRQLRSDSRANVVLLEGNRRTGKTSILKRLQDPEVLPDWITVNCSLQGGEGHASEAGLPTKEVFRLMARDLGWATHAAGVRVWLPDADAPEPGKPFKVAFVRALRRAFSGDRPFEAFELFLQMVIEASRPLRVLLMLDEFDKLQEGIDAGVTSPQVPENIRYLLHTYPELSAVLAGSRRIKRLREEYWSALFGFGHRVPISGLRVEDARRLVTRPVDGRLVYVPEARDLVVKLCAKQPFLIQSLCNRIFESAARSNRRMVTVDDVNTAAHAMTEDNEHFRTLWGYAGSERRRFLLALCRRLGDRVPITLDVLERNLRRHSVHLHRGERLGDDLEFLRELEMLELHGTRSGSSYRLAIPLMAAWIERNEDFENQRRRAVEEFEEADRGDGYWDATEEGE